MQISNRFTIAVHICVCLLVFEQDHKLTSEFLAGSTGVNPVMIRQSLQRLRKAGLVRTKRGSGGSVLARSPETITLLDIYRSSDPYLEKSLFSFHDPMNPDCPVASHMHQLMDHHLDSAQKAMESYLESVTLQDLYREAGTLSDTDALFLPGAAEDKNQS